ncbi:MAG: hypothetical protein AB3N24_06000, partial [Leisingera sp.]
MKFIKDIIGEKRTRVQQGGFAQEAVPVQPPEPDSMAAFFADTGEAADDPQPPLRLDGGYRMDSEPEDAPAVTCDNATAGSAPAEETPEERVPAGTAGFSADEPAPAPAARIPDEDAIAAFFAREQDTPEEAGTDLLSEISEGKGEDRDLQDGGSGIGEDIMLGAPDDGADFSNLGQPEALQEDDSGRKPYRIFTRRLKTDAGQTSEAGDAAAEAAAVPQAEAMPEQALEPEQEQEEPQQDRLSERLAQRPLEDPLKTAAAVPPVAAPAAPPAEAIAEPAAAAPIDVPAPSMGRGASRAGRVKTRLLGFSPGQAAGSDPFARSAEDTAPGYTQ